jgi:hypothetical protein
MGELFRALISAHFHLATLRAKAKAPEHGVSEKAWAGYRAWGERLDRLSSGRRLLLDRVQPVDRAVQTLGEHRERCRYGHRNLWRHATSVLAEVHSVTQRSEHDPIPGLALFIEQSLGSDGLAEIVSPPHGYTPMSRAHEALRAEVTRRGRALTPIGKPVAAEETVGRGTSPQIVVTEAGRGTDGVTRFAAHVTHASPTSDTFVRVAAEADPRNWTKDFPEMFANSYRIRDAREIVDRYEDPDPFDDGKPLGETWDPPGPLFETAQFAIGGTPLVVFRNVLDITFTARKGEGDFNGQIDLGYSLHEALTNSVLEFVVPGGLDVDSVDKGTCQVLLKELGDGNIERTTKAGKNLRFSEDAEFSEEQNLLALPFTQAWITQLLFNSARL